MRKILLKNRSFPISRLPRYPAAFLLVLLLCGRCAAAELVWQPVPTFYLSLNEKLQGPTLPTKPIAPVKPSLDGRQERPAAPLPRPEAPPRHAAPEKAAPPNEKRPADPPDTAVVKERPANGAPDAKNAGSPAENETATSGKTTAAAQKNMAEEQDHQRFIQTWIKNSLYFLLIFAACGAILYISHKHPPKAKNAQTKARPQTSRKPRPNSAPVFPDDSLNPSIKNKSLLEQLVRYDMETYGELRSTLNYDQPAYVELLIRKYGGGDTDKINRAIHLFHARRNKP